MLAPFASIHEINFMLFLADRFVDNTGPDYKGKRKNQYVAQ